MYEGQKVVAVVNAAGDQRGLGLLPLGERPLLWHLIKRIQSASTVDEILVLIDDDDQQIPALLEWMGAQGVRTARAWGPDLLEQTYQALITDPPQVVAPIGVERPLFSPPLLEMMIRHLIDSGLDAVDAAAEKTGMTPGLDISVLRFQALVDAHLLALAPELRQETTRFIMERPQAFRVSYLQPPQPLCSQVRLLVEDEEDYEQMRHIYKALYRPGELVDSEQVVEWLGRRAVA